MSHPPYSPDPSPCDYDLFPRLKENMRVVSFEDLEELEDAVAEQVRMYERGCLATGNTEAAEVIKHKGNYFEGF